jgi:hypothetical protein
VLADFTIDSGAYWAERAVRIEYRDGGDRCAAVFPQIVLEQTFDPVLRLRPPDRQPHPHEWHLLAEENLPALGRIISARHERDAAASGRPVRRVEITLADIQGSGESFTRDALPIKTGKSWSEADLGLLQSELRHATPLLQIADRLKRDVVEVETMADRLFFPY